MFRSIKLKRRIINKVFYYFKFFRIIQRRLKNAGSVSTHRIGKAYKDNGKTKTSILLNHLKKDKLEKKYNAPEVVLYKQFKDIMSLIKNYLGNLLKQK